MQLLATPQLTYASVVHYSFLCPCRVPTQSHHSSWFLHKLTVLHSFLCWCGVCWFDCLSVHYSTGCSPAAPAVPVAAVAFAAAITCSPACHAACPATGCFPVAISSFLCWCVFCWVVCLSVLCPTGCWAAAAAVSVAAVSFAVPRQTAMLLLERPR